MARNRKRKGERVHGWLNLDKPADMTSTQCVGALKRIFNAQKVGHGGTLDPLATGILPIAFGEATKTVQWMMDAEKDYMFTIKWGVSTDSQDAEGETIATSDARPSRADIDAWLDGFTGETEQVPPKFSAIKIDGQRAYDLAREGEDFTLPSRKIIVHNASVHSMPDVDHTILHVRSGKGFYVRAMARDLAFDLGAEGHIVQLRRMRVGVFDEKEAVTLAQIEALEGDRQALLDLLRPLQCVLEDMPKLDITSEDAAQIRQGRMIMLLPHVVERWQAERDAAGNDRTALALCDGRAVAMGEVRAGRFQPGKVFQL